jgi:ABC-type Fe3+-citrate transport system substrate-binding protein
MDKETLKGLEHLINTSSDLMDINLTIAILTNNADYDDNREVLLLLVDAISKKHKLEIKLNKG